MADSLHVFLVEADDAGALVLRRALERAGHRISHCQGAADALQILEQSAFDLIVIDHELPDLSGLELLQTLVNDGRDPPVLFLARQGDERLAAQVLRAGALDYLKKDDALTYLAELPKRVQESATRHRLLRSNRLLIQAVESAADGVAITDLQGGIQHVNAALECLSGYPRAELLGQNVRLFKSSNHPAALFAELWRTVLGRASWQGELINRKKDGTTFDASVTISPLVDDRGNLTHFVGLYRDISERKRLERQLIQAEKMQSVGTLAGGVAHEFNNLLAGIQGYASLALREQGVDGTPREFLQNIVSLSERAATLTRSLLAYARKPTLHRQRTSLAQLLQQTADLVRQTLGLEVTLELPADDAAHHTLADGNQLQQALVNLALNARDAGKGNEPIAFRLRPLTLTEPLLSFPEKVPAGEFLVLEVADHGQGMTPEVLHQSLNPFFTTKEVGQGTGLGLPVVLGIVHGHQGFLSIDTQPGVGTTVSLYLPQLRDASSEPTTEPTEKTLKPGQAPGRDILVVDDQEAVLDIVRRFLEIANHRVTCVDSGAAALEHLQAGKRVELVILDLMIPQEGGDRTFERIRQLRPDLPVLLCTGLLQPRVAEQLLKEKRVGLLRKPFRMNELWDAVQQALAS